MDLAKLAGQQLLKISQSAETGQHVIEFTPPPLEQVIEIDPTKLDTTEVEIDPSKMLEAIKVNANESTSTQHVIEIDGQRQVLNIGDNQHIILLQEGHESEVLYNYCEENQPVLRFGSYSEFKCALNEYESQTITKFILRNQSKQFTAPVCLHDILRNEKNSSDLPMIRWEFCAAKDFLPIPYMGIPYISVGKQVFQCHQGKDYNTNKKQQYELRKEILNQATRFQIKSRNKGPSKKLDCPVLFAVRKLYFFPEYPLETNTKRNRALVAQKLRGKLTQIKKEICTCTHKESGDNTSTENDSSNILGKLEYFTRFPPNNEHNHDVAKAANFMKLQLKKHGSKGVEIMQTKKTSEANPYQYDKHVELITALRASGDLDQLRNARENMSNIYPLTEELWMDWFQDELPLAVIPEQKQFIVSKFELAVKDYASIKIWHEYCQYMMNNIESPADIERARNVFESAITSVGLHVTEGSSIWDGYREFEIAILDSYQQLQDSGDTVGMDAKVQSQIERISYIFRRQLSVPLLGMADTYKIFDDWSTETVPGETRRAYDKATQKLSLCMEYEEKLHAAEGNKLAEYFEYINFEMKDGDPARIQCIFERAIKDNCLQQDLWERYTTFLDFKLKLVNVAIPVHERAVRNCPWVGKLWQNYLKALERGNLPYEKYKEVFNQSLKGGFGNANEYLQVWLVNCDYHRRRISEWAFEEDKVEELHKSFESGITYMNHYFGLEGDKYCVLLREWAHIEAKYLQNVKRGQELWDTVMKKHSRDPLMWMEYVHYLMLFSDVVTVRRVFQRAVQISFDQPESICEAFIKFERQYGTLEEVDDAQQKVDTQLERIKEKKKKDALKDASFQADQRKKNKHKNKEDAGKAGKKKKKKKEIKENPLKRGMKDENSAEIQTKKLKENEDFAGMRTAGGIEVQSKYFNISNTHEGERMDVAATIQTSGEVTSEVSTSAEHPPPQQPEQLEEKASDGVDKVDNNLSIFLSNLLFTVDEMHLRSMFEECGEIETIRIIVNKAGKSKGYAYLQFKNKESVAEALKLDRETLLGRPVFVSECVDKKEKPTEFKFPTTLDKHTLYVSNLPFELTSDQLKEHFVQAGQIKQFRLVTNRSGKSKGYAYVEYEKEADATSALLKLDKTVLNNRPINVALSNPPARKQQKQNQPAHEQTKPEVKDIPGSRGRSKTQLSLVPRSLQKASNDSKTQVAATSTPTSKTSSSSSSMSGAMSNNDFRKFLLKK
ncbi:squamous cell carcinoma antigen recognized by T-cells 3-like isoform X2 [Hydractinia symbiolongicarpus]|uniref:squamous cell carcinoma antigen recognized by T-cells 3-like isoform X2 n=1 Tax=Hydractinia symbiolongicarpus TaxID=13093 RepID=UPI00254FBC23|nr:squamous cell carcinoma antigen recognized by T-cells 3-like isoform X2 [Hydractinia symbiolongicarpus]